MVLVIPATFTVLGDRGFDIREVDITDTSVPIPIPHGVDGFLELSAALFVDAAGVNPDHGVAIGVCFLACVHDFSVPRAALDFFDPSTHSWREALFFFRFQE
jgi:hypothetical protein